MKVRLMAAIFAAGGGARPKFAESCVAMAVLDAASKAETRSWLIPYYTQ